MITIICNFRQKIGVFLKNQRHDHFFHNLALFCVKNVNLFDDFIGENI
jgi:hypothetical protein